MGDVREAMLAPASRADDTAQPAVFHTLQWLSRRPCLDTTYALVDIVSPLAVVDRGAPLSWAPQLALRDAPEEDLAGGELVREGESVADDGEADGYASELDGLRLLGGPAE